MLWLIWVLAAILALVIQYRNSRSRFIKSGVKMDTMVPLFGTMTKIVFQMEHLIDSMTKTYYKFPKERFVARFEFTKPVLFVRDLELIKKITIKDFEHFLDHRVFFSSESDPLFARNLFSIKGQEWKDMRSTLSPAFTSSKMRTMVPFMVEVGDQMILNIKKTMQENGSSYVDMDVKDLMTRFANDVIASCAFGLKVDSHTDRGNDFYTQGLVAATFKFKQFMVFFLSSSIPWLLSLLKLRIFNAESQNFFRNLTLSTMHEREKHNIIRPDMIHLLMEAKKGKLKHDEKAQTQDEKAGFATAEESAFGKKTVNRVWTDDDLIAQAMIFFVAGFETVSASMSFLLYELAMNPDVQDRLVAEIRETDAATGGKFDFNVILQMTYMDMVVSELLRKWSPAAMMDRICTKDYNMGKPNEDATEDYIIRKGEGLQIPVFTLHRNPEYFPDPDRFDPERFSDDNKHNIKPFTYIPFGLGPRNCIGSRFALCEVKAMAYLLLRHVEVSPCPRTQTDPHLDPGSFNILMKGGHWLRLTLRS